MFAYCNNNPVNASDPTGYDSSTDENGNGIPDYLEKRWEVQTKKAKAKDITDELNALMSANASSLKRYYLESLECYLLAFDIDAVSYAYVDAALFFAERVKAGGEWDLKNGPYPYDEYFKYCGGIYSGEDIGNIHYGYVGSALFSSEILHCAAGAYQVWSGGSSWSYYSYLFDEPRDYSAVEIGIQQYYMH